MLARIGTVAFEGTSVLPIDVQVQISSGLVAFMIVGLPDKAVAESRERVRSSLHALGLALPAKRITVNLAPADVVKEGSHFDLPIALAVLGAMGVLPKEELASYVALGELGLDGATAKVAGALPAAIAANAAQKSLICPKDNGNEAVWASEDLPVLAAPSLLSLINHFKGVQVLNRPEPHLQVLNDNAPTLDLRDIKGQETAKRALEVVAAGGHNLLMIGPPGSGKSMLASRLPSLLPPLEPDEALEVSMIHSLAGLLEGGRLLRHRPYRDPHHSATLPALIGGGVRAKPGEISLAHHGVLFLDELPEFQRATLEALRQPLETGRAVISRANHHVSYPARIQLIAAMNPCRCGYLSDPDRACGRAPKCALEYQSRISGPLFDRIDCHVEVPEVSPTDLALPPAREGSAEVAARVAKVRQIQRERYAALARKAQASIRTNAEAEGEILEQVTPLNEPARQLLVKATEHLKLSARGYHRVLRVARTLADMAEQEQLESTHIAEALSYRRLKM
ncbi:MAG: ATP-binding protein [Proteobacteria bacterium]|nr:ATP-binding protein [Pseudomonadota bacterium]